MTARTLVTHALALLPGLLLAGGARLERRGRPPRDPARQGGPFPRDSGPGGRYNESVRKEGPSCESPS